MPLRIGPLVFCAGVALFRAVWLSIQLSGFRASEVGYLLLADLPVLGGLGLLAHLESGSRRSIRVLVVFGMVVLALVYLADVLLVVSLNSRLQVNDIFRFGRNWWLIPSYLNLRSVSVLAVFLALFFVRIPPSRASRRATALISTPLLLFGLLGAGWPVPSHLEKYTGSVFLLSKEIWGLRRSPASVYKPGDFNTYAEEFEASFDAPFAKTKRHVILLIVESLSAADSFRTSGLRNELSQFDELSHEGRLFRNFYANFEGSEGGIVALLSGVPPLHFPTASTNTFAEYAVQNSVTRTFARSGYRCEFLTGVPLDFISMDTYARSPFVGFSHAAGQKEIDRFKGAPRYGFESPTDHLLYEEILSRLDLRRGGAHGPAFLVAVTASSHSPYIDPLGRGDTERNVWSYVQQEFWWLYRELQRRRFFDDGLLIITGDHRKMVPIAEEERRRYGESAKARIPLLIIGADIPKNTVDDRFFQQSDLLRMLDRVGDARAQLSRFALWPERYIFVYGIASNASNVQVFVPEDEGRRAYALNLRGAEVDWADPPSNAFEIERSIHRQRASQQAERQARLGWPILRFGRDLTASRGSPGVLVGLSSDVDLARDPDDRSGGLKLVSSDSFGLGDVRRLAPDLTGAFTMTVRAFLRVERDGPYWFSVYANSASCLAIDREVVLACRSGLNEGLALLTAGFHRFDLRFIRRGAEGVLDVKWLPPGKKQFEMFPQRSLLQPAM